jgi:chorismate-pyruvate lyase
MRKEALRRKPKARFARRDLACIVDVYDIEQIGQSESVCISECSFMRSSRQIISNEPLLIHEYFLCAIMLPCCRM